jgi:hypothetical protein
MALLPGGHNYDPSLDATLALADLAHRHRRTDHGGGDDRLFYVSAPDGGCGFKVARRWGR